VLIRIGPYEIYAKSQASEDIQAARDYLLKTINTASVRPGT
jgi:hypothetical protein